MGAAGRGGSSTRGPDSLRRARDATGGGSRTEFADFGHSFGGTYLELVPGERIVHTDAFETDEPSMAGEMTVTVTFEEVPEGTEVTVLIEIPAAWPDEAIGGWEAALGNLVELVA